MRYFFIKCTIALFSILILICCGKVNLPYLGDGYHLINDGEYTLELVNAQNDVLIGPHILAYAYDANFIIVLQRPWDIPGVPNIEEMTFHQRDEAFETSTFRQFWIINKKNENEYSFDTSTNLVNYPNVFGPLTKEEYIHKRVELGVSKELQLID